VYKGAKEAPIPTTAMGKYWQETPNPKQKLQTGATVLLPAKSGSRLKGMKLKASPSLFL